MSLIHRFRDLFSANSSLSEKQPNFVVSGYPSNNQFLNLVEREDNYFDQYVLYTAKAIDYISNKVASTEWFIKDKRTQEPLEPNDVFQDFQAVNPFLTMEEALKLVETHKRLVGSAYWYIDRDPQENAVFELYPLDPTKMQLKTDKTGLPSYYEYTDGDGKVVRLESDEIVYFRRLNPKNWFQGQSQVRELQYIHNAFVAGAQYNLNAFGNDGTPNGFFFFDNISDEQRERLEGQLRNKYQGVRNASRVGILNKRPEWIPVSNSPKEMSYVEGMKMMRQDILSMFGIPEALVFPSATNSNTERAEIGFQRDTLLPALKEIKGVINKQLLRKLEGTRRGKFDFEFDFVSPIPEDTAALVDQAARLAESGVFTRNQALEYIGIVVEDEDMFVNQVGQQQQGEQDSGDSETDKRLKSIETRLLEQRVAEDRAAMKQQFTEDAEDVERRFASKMHSFFQEQAQRVFEKIGDKPTLRKLPGEKEENQVLTQAIKPLYEELAADANNDANIELKQKLYKANSKGFTAFENKALTGEVLKEIEERVNFFADELNSTSLDKLRKALSEGIQGGLRGNELKKEIARVFNGFVDGIKNIEQLTRYNIYVPEVEVEDQVNFKDEERYRTMYNNAQNLPEAEKRSALLALRGLVDKSTSIGSQVAQDIDKELNYTDDSISESRLTTVSRTEGTFVKNKALQDTYDQNEFVKGYEWVATNDLDTRAAHARADGQVTPKNEPFSVGGEKLKRPGDSSLGASASNTINCRCRITAVVE